jgi:uncharacterized protein
MRGRAILDTGPLVALLDVRDRYHRWATAQWAQTAPPLLTCEAVLSEACFLVRRLPRGSSAIVELIDRGAVEVAFRLNEHIEPVRRLLAKYAEVPMSLADACLVRMAELHSNSSVLTIDRHFRIYRKHGRQVIPALMPPD